MIGELKHRVTIQEPARAGDGGGGFAETWADIASVPEVYAAIAPLSTGERLNLSQLGTVATHRMTIRWRDDVAAHMRLVGGGDTYKIISAADAKGDRRFLEILAARQ